MTAASGSRLLDQPRAVWAVAFACVVAFMGIGLVDPILPTLADELNATPSEVSLLFTSYFAMTGVSMLVTGWAASRIGPRRTLLVGLALVVAFSTLAGPAGSVVEIAAFRLGWGLGNALFIATALSVIVGAASGGLTSAIILYEAALGLGIASGPLLGGLLGGISWRGPFLGTAVLMAIGFILIVVMLGPVPKPARRGLDRRPAARPRPRRAALDGDRRRPLQLRLLHDPRLHAVPARLSTHQLGIVYFGWGLLVALTSCSPRSGSSGASGWWRCSAPPSARSRWTCSPAASSSTPLPGSSPCVVVSGGLLGIVNTVLTEAVMAAAVVERQVASSAYSFVRFTGGAIAPYVAGKLGEHVSRARRCTSGRHGRALRGRARALAAPPARRASEVETPSRPRRAARAILVGDRREPAAGAVVETAERVARSREAAVHVVHVRETRTVGDDAADLETAGEPAPSSTPRSGSSGAAASRTPPARSCTSPATTATRPTRCSRPRRADRARGLLVGRPDRHGGEPGAREPQASVSPRRAPVRRAVVVVGPGSPRRSRPQRVTQCAAACMVQGVGICWRTPSTMLRATRAWVQAPSVGAGARSMSSMRWRRRGRCV